MADDTRTLADYRPQHDEGCAVRDSFKPPRCTCGLDALIAAVRAEREPTTAISFPPEVDAKMRETDAAVERPHGPVSERFMRHHYGASGYVPPDDAATQVDQLLHDASRAVGGYEMAVRMNDPENAGKLKLKAARLFAEALALDPEGQSFAWFQ